MPELFVPDAADRETLGAFVARAVGYQLYCEIVLCEY